MIIEEHDMKKGYDGYLFKRLFSYTKPYLLWIILALVLLLGVVGVELVRPVLIGNAVDEVIANYKKVYKEVDENTVGATQIADTYWILDNGNEEENKGTIIIGDEGNYFFVPHISQKQVETLKDNYHVSKINEAYYIDDEDLVVIPLSIEDIENLRKTDYANLIRIMIIFILIIIAGLIFNYFQTLVLNYAGQHIIYNIREEIFTHLQNLSIQFFSREPVGKLVTRVTNDTETLNEMYTSVIVNSIKNIVMLVGISIMMLILDWKLTLVTFVVIPLILIATSLFRRYSRGAYRDVRTKVAEINSFLSEHISGMSVVQIFAKEDEKMNEFKKINKDLLGAHIRQLLSFSIFRPSMYFIYIIGLTIILGYGSSKVMAGTLSIGTLIIFIQYISSFFNPINQLAEQFNILQSAMASSEKIFSILDTKDIIEDKKDAIELEDVKGNIEFKNVWFAYDEEQYVLKDISFKVKKGETIAFVGATGAGKTSILNLLSRYYEIQKGEILLDGINIKNIKKKNIRKNVGQMLQDVFLFTGDIKSNIRLRDESITDEEIIKASKFVNAHKYICKLSHQYDEHVYERGATLSSGQRQLLSFARTLAYKPKILILDEATANIDTETELLIQDGLYKIMEGRTTLVVAHRLSTIQHADKIIVLHKGRIKEMGKHQELLAKKGIYYQLYQLQYQDIN